MSDEPAAALLDDVLAALAPMHGDAATDPRARAFVAAFLADIEPDLDDLHPLQRRLAIDNAVTYLQHHFTAAALERTIGEEGLTVPAAARTRAKTPSDASDRSDRSDRSDVSKPHPALARHGLTRQHMHRACKQLMAALGPSGGEDDEGEWNLALEMLDTIEEVKKKALENERTQKANEALPVCAGSQKDNLPPPVHVRVEPVSGPPRPAVDAPALPDGGAQVAPAVCTPHADEPVQQATPTAPSTTLIEEDPQDTDRIHESQPATPAQVQATDHEPHGKLTGPELEPGVTRRTPHRSTRRVKPSNPVSSDPPVQPRRSVRSPIVGRRRKRGP